MLDSAGAIGQAWFGGGIRIALDLEATPVIKLDIRSLKAVSGGTSKKGHDGGHGKGHGGKKSGKC